MLSNCSHTSTDKVLSSRFQGTLQALTTSSLSEFMCAWCMCRRVGACAYARICVRMPPYSLVCSAVQVFNSFTAIPENNLQQK